MYPKVYLIGAYPGATREGVRMAAREQSRPPGERREHALDVDAVWHRWEPHVHAPGTKLNDQFSGVDPWDQYLERLEASTPVMRAIGVTDYYSLECYERLVASKAAGRLPNCSLLFPNIEMRLGIGTVNDAFVNLHLLVSPADPDHVAQVLNETRCARSNAARPAALVTAG